MLQTSQTDYASVLSEFLQLQIVIFGPQVVHAKIAGIKGLSYDKDGIVKKMDGDPQTVLQEVSKSLSELSELAVKKSLDHIVKNHTRSDGASVPQTSALNNSQDAVLSSIKSVQSR